MLCLCGAAFFSAARTALSSLSESQARKLVEEKGSYALQQWREHPQRVNAGLLVGHILVQLGAGALSVRLASQILEDRTLPGWLGSGLVPLILVGVLLLVLVFGDAVPRAVGKRRAQQLAAPLVTMSILPQLLVSPLTLVYVSFSRGVLKLFGANDEPGPPTVTAEDLEHMLDQGALEGSFTEDGERLLRSVFEFSDTVVRELMVPRTDVVSLTIDMSLDEIIDELVACGHSRLPVYEGSIDEIVGVFYAKDVLNVMANGRVDSFHLRDYLRRPYFVPESKRVAELLTEFQSERLHMAIVVDEFGGTSGVITMEDISEEIFGDIQDEYDVEPPQMVTLDEKTVQVDARVPIHEIEEFFDMELPEHPDYESLGGFLMTQAGGVPEPGHEVLWQGLRFRVLEADPKKVITVLIESLGDSEQQPPEEMVS